MTCSGSEQFELLSQGRQRITGVPRLLLAHHVDHLDAAQDHTGNDNGLRAKHRRIRLGGSSLFARHSLNCLKAPC